MGSDTRKPTHLYKYMHYYFSLSGPEQTRMPRDSGELELIEYMGIEEQPEYVNCMSSNSTHVQFEGDPEPLYEMCVAPSYMEPNDLSQSTYENLDSTIAHSGRPQSLAYEYEAPQSRS